MAISTPTRPAVTSEPIRITSSAQRRRMPLGLRDRLLAVATPLALLAVWEVLARAAVIDTRFFPAPTDIFAQLVTLATTGELWSHMAVSLRRLALGFVVGVIPGLFIGVAMGLFRPVRAAVKPLISGTYPIPKSALLPLILLIFGLGETSKVAMVAIGVFYPVALNALTGVAQVAPIYYDVSKNFGASRWQTFRTVAIPGAMPNIVTGIELGAGLGLILIAIAEMVGAQSGLGFMIWNAWQLYSVETMYVGLVVIALIGYAVSLLISYLGRLVTPWQTTR
ncbi:ABC transporter permease [Georgenia sp. AZ-5]|uniref:ABC transporter permease n=1 Tax=Georgenia sp. AZ-5 TaxID=3367526 RepID=UPI003754D15F